MSRSDHREDIFPDDLDRVCCFVTLSEACAKADWRVRAYCLVSNHDHLVRETPDPNLVAVGCHMRS